MNKKKILIGGHQLSWSTSIAPEDILPRAEKIKESGCEAFEFFLNTDSLPTSVIKGTMEKVGLTPIGCAIIREEIEGDPLSTDEVLRRRCEEAIEKYITWTCDMGGSLIVGPLANVLGRKDARCPTQKELEAGIKTFRNVAVFAKSKEVKVAIEPLQWSKMPWPNTVNDVLAFIDYVERGNNIIKGVLGVLFDIYHAIRMEENWQSALQLALNARKLFHVHIAGPNRTPPKLGQHIGWRTIISTLKEAGWEGTITIKSFGRECDLPFAVVGPGERPPAEEVIKTGVETLRTIGASC